MIDRIIDVLRNLYENSADRLYRLSLRAGPFLDNLRDLSREHWQKILIFGVGGPALFIAAFTGIVFGIYVADRAELIVELDEYKEWLHGRGRSEKKPAIVIYDAGGRPIGEYLPERGSRMTMNVCGDATWLKNAVVSAEDRDFYDHGGVSLRGIVRAIYNNVRTFSLREGGGTVTQQVARNLFTDRARSFTRKLYETFAAWLIESKLSKEEILCLYLNKIYMGEGRIGAEEASWFYFRKPPQNLNAAEAAMIVGLFPSPVYYSPLNNIELSLKKQRLVLDALQEAGHLDEKERNIAYQAFLKKYRVETGGDDPDPGEIGRYGASRDFRYNAAPTANEHVKDILHSNTLIQEEVVREGGLRVYTTIDLDRQRAALQALRSSVATARAKILSDNANNKSFDARDMEKISRRMNGAFVALDSNTGDIRAMVGGYAVNEGTMTRRVWAMRRQPGSTIKGALYAVALDEGVYRVNDVVIDEKINIGGYSPRNWNGKYLGPVPLRQALAMSINTVAVKTLDRVGISRFRSFLSSALDLSFFESGDRFPGNLSLALGSAEVTPMELARIYATIENGGRVVEPRLITRIEDRDGKVIYQDYRRRDDGALVLSEDACAEAVKLMQSVFDPDVDGTVSYIGKRRASNANYLPFPIAGKTGTVQIVAETRKKYPGMRGVRDAWFVGLAPGEAAVVWLGHDEGAPFRGSGSQAASVWAGYAQDALRGKVAKEWPRVDDVLIEDPVIDLEEPEEGEDPQTGDDQEFSDSEADESTIDTEPVVEKPEESADDPPATGETTNTEPAKEPEKKPEETPPPPVKKEEEAVVP